MDLVEIARRALDEDGWNATDRTTQALENYLHSQAARLGTSTFTIVAKQNGVFSGQHWIEAIAAVSSLSLRACVAEGEIFEKGQIVCRGQGPAAQVLRVERVLLNFLQHLCGIATQTRDCVDRVCRRAESLGVHAPGIFHTRKTLPLYREAQIAAVIAGGGRRHRTSLSERILFKENHKFFVAGEFEKFLAFLLKHTDGPSALVEVENIDEAVVASKLGVRALMLDNFAPADIAETLTRISPAIEVEVSGGIHPGNIEGYVQRGVHRISLGSLTHTVRAVDLSLDWERAGG